MVFDEKKKTGKKRIKSSEKMNLAERREGKKKEEEERHSNRSRVHSYILHYIAILSHAGDELRTYPKHC